MSARINRRALTAGLLAATAAPVVAKGRHSVPALRGDDTERLPDHAALWARMPLPFTPAQAWHLLSPATQVEIGAAVIGMHLAQYVHGDSVAEVDCFLDGDLRDDASDVAHDILNRMDDRLWALLPDLYGPDGDHPRWALDAGMVHPLGTVLPEPAPTLAAIDDETDEADPTFAAIERARDAEAAFATATAALPDFPTDEQEAAADQVGHASDAAADALLTIRPTTFAGVVALLAYLGEVIITDGGRDQIQRLAALLADGPPLV